MWRHIIQSALTMQIFSAVDVEFVFPPHIDHSCIFLHQGRVEILDKVEQLKVDSA